MRINLETADVERAGRAEMWVLDMEPQPDGNLEWKVGLDIGGAFRKAFYPPVCYGDPLEFAEPWAAIKSWQEYGVWFYDDYPFDDVEDLHGEVQIVYQANPPPSGQGGCTWRPASEMPDWAIRLRRTVESVTAKRLGEITEAEARRLGFAGPNAYVDFGCNWTESGRAWQPERHVWCVGTKGANQ